MELSPKLKLWLKILATVASIIGGAMGSYHASRSDSKAEASVSYETMRQAVNQLKENQTMMWQLMLRDGRQPPPLPTLQPLPALPTQPPAMTPSASRPSVRGTRITLGGIGGHGFGSGGGVAAPALVQAPLPPPPSMKPLPRTLDDAVNQQRKSAM